MQTKHHPPASLSGLYVALLTGFSDTGALDSKRQATLVDCALKQGLKGLYIGGSSGESGLMSTAELLEQQQVIADLPQAKTMQIIAHVGQPNLSDSIALAQQAEQLGFAALSALPPHSYPFSDEEVYAYYKTLSEASSLPLIVYEIPMRTGCPLPFDLLLRMLDLPRVDGIKFTSTDLFKFSMLRRQRPTKTFFYGFDEIFASAAILGCDGGIGTTYGVLGSLYLAIHTALEANQVSEARRLQTISQEFVEILADIGVIPGIKLALRVLGYDVGHARAPFGLRRKDAEPRLKAFLQRADVKKWCC